MRPMLLLVLLLGGCVAPIPGDDVEGRAVQIVWRELLGESRPPPRISWDPEGPCLPLPMRLRGICADGFLLGHVAYVYWSGDIPRSAFTHELVHEWLLLTTGQVDDPHSDGIWAQEAVFNARLADGLTGAGSTPRN